MAELIGAARSPILAAVDETPPESKFGKSKSNRKTENRGLALLLQDPRFQAVDLATKRRILELLPVKGEFGIQTFDAVMTQPPVPPIAVEDVESLGDMLTLIEMKTTTKPIRNTALNGFFFGATEREYAMAKALGDRYKFAFVVLNDTNDYGRPFFVLLSLDELDARTRMKRTQFQVNLRSDTVHDPAVEYYPGIVVDRADASNENPEFES